MSIEKIKELRKMLDQNDTERCHSREYVKNELIYLFADYLIEQEACKPIVRLKDLPETTIISHAKNHELVMNMESVYDKNVYEGEGIDIKHAETILSMLIGKDVCIIEQEEQKEECDIKLFDFDKIDFSDFRFKVDVALGNDVVVEVGQIWRGERLYEIKSVKGARANVINENGEEESLIINNILKYSRLITMNNIKEGEWVECIEDCGTTVEYKKGEKYMIAIIVTCDFVEMPVAKNGDDKGEWHFVRGFSNRFKPCLPPMEEKEPIEPPTVSEYKGYIEEEEELKTIKHVGSPLGMKPKWLHDEMRLQEVQDTIERFNLVEKPVPEEWVNEFNELSGQIQESCQEEKVAEKLAAFQSVANMIYNKAVKYTQEDLDKAREEGNKAIRRSNDFERMLKEAEDSLYTKEEYDRGKADLYKIGYKEGEVSGVRKADQEIEELKKDAEESIKKAYAEGHSEGYKVGKNTARDINKMSIKSIRDYLEMKERENQWAQHSSWPVNKIDSML